MDVAANKMTLRFRCPPELESVLPRPYPAVLGLPEWFKSMPPRAFNPSVGVVTDTIKRCPSVLDAMTYGFLIPSAVDLEVRDGEFTWDFDAPGGLISAFSHSPIDFHDPSQIAGTPLFEDDRFIIKFNCFWTIEAPPGYSLLFTHPVNRADLPFTTLTALIDCDTFHDSPLNFPARWHDAKFNGVLPKGTPVAQCLPVKRESWDGQFDALSSADIQRMVETQRALLSEPGVYRRQFRAPKR
jgi:hypothetical protein